MVTPQARFARSFGKPPARGGARGADPAFRRACGARRPGAGQRHPRQP